MHVIQLENLLKNLIKSGINESVPTVNTIKQLGDGAEFFRLLLART